MRSINSLILLACLTGSLIWIGAARGASSEPLTGSQPFEPTVAATVGGPPILVPSSVHDLLSPPIDRPSGPGVPPETPPSARPPAPTSSSLSLAPSREVDEGWSVSAPAIAVDATLAPFGLTPAGVMEVPADGRTVAWYRFTAVPGAAGNAVLAAHVDWAGAPGAFHRIRHASTGDLILITSPASTSFTYRVDTVELVEARTADVSAIVGTKEGPATLTMITCGGRFNTAAGAYEHRVIVRASLLPSLPSEAQP